MAVNSQAGRGPDRPQVLFGPVLSHRRHKLDAVVLAWGNPYYTQFSLATLGSRPPHVAISHLPQAPILARAGLLEPLNENELAPYGLTGGNFTPTAWNMAHTNGICTRSRSICTRS